MGTNYYASIMPPSDKIDALCDALKHQRGPHDIQRQVNSLFGNFNVEDGEPSGNIVHLGKRSAGWKFLWNPNIYLIKHSHCIYDDDGKFLSVRRDPNQAWYLYPLTKQGIIDFVMRKDIQIFNEYDEHQDKDEFLKMAFEWDGWDSKTYLKEHPEDAWTCRGEYIDLLKAEGFEFTDSTNADFYSDGLRFSSSNNFS